MRKETIMGVAVILSVIGAVSFMYRGSNDALQTSLVKYLDGASHQCVAYVERYYQNMFNIKISNVVVAMNLAERAPRYGLYFHENGSAIIPQPGDVIVFGNKNKIGHVAIVTGTLKDGVLIVEQNWTPSKITTNHGKALSASYIDGKYTIADRYYSKVSKDKFWIMGWVSRHDKNPSRFFQFTNENDEGWMPEHDVRYYKGDDAEVWGVKINGKDPRILSPIFLDGIDVKNNKQIVFRARVRSNNNATEGVVYFRDENNQWSEQIPFAVDYSNEEYQTFFIDISSLRSDFRITQMKLKLANGNSNKNKEIWEVDWFRIGDKVQDIL